MESRVLVRTNKYAWFGEARCGAGRKGRVGLGLLRRGRLWFVSGFLVVTDEPQRGGFCFRSPQIPYCAKVLPGLLAADGTGPDVIGVWSV
tara:strand:+ start:160 stop:429 length:270 start_codon:yes stop_codon:yes gene_type:complete